MDLTDDARAEMRAAVLAYVEFVESVSNTRVVETRLASRIVPDHFGTADCIVRGDVALHVIDFKYGTFPVAAQDNLQLACYLNLAREIYPECDAFLGTIVQPRVGDGTPQTRIFTREFLDDVRIQVIESSVDTALHAGPHCRWCPLLATCAEADRAMNEAAYLDFDAIPNDTLPDDDTTRLVRVMEFGPVAMERARQAHLRLLQAAQHGENVPGYTTVQTFRKRAWRNPKTTLDALHHEFPTLLGKFEKSVLLSPAQVEKIVSKPRLAKLGLVTKPPAGVALAPLSADKPRVIFDEFDVIG
jgi:hypothetical protein